MDAVLMIMNCIDKFMSQGNYEDFLAPAVSSLQQTLGYILHNDKNHYKTLKRIKNRTEAEKNRF